MTALGWRHSTGRRREGDPWCPWAGQGAGGLCLPCAARASWGCLLCPPSPEMPGAGDTPVLGCHRVLPGRAQHGVCGTARMQPGAARCVSPVSSCRRRDRHSRGTAMLGQVPNPPARGCRHCSLRTSRASRRKWEEGKKCGFRPSCQSRELSAGVLALGSCCGSWGSGVCTGRIFPRSAVVNSAACSFAGRGQGQVWVQGTRGHAGWP